MRQYVNINAREKRLVMEGAPAFGDRIVADLTGEGSYRQSLKGRCGLQCVLSQGHENVVKYTVKVTFKENYRGSKSVKLYSGWSKAKSVTTKK